MGLGWRRSRSVHSDVITVIVWCIVEMSDIILEQHLSSNKFDLLEKSISKEEYENEEYFEFEVGNDPVIYLRIIRNSW